MIRAADLRIGNLIYGKIRDPKWGELKNHIAEVSDIHKDRFTCRFVEQGGYADSDYANDFEPIPLSEKILESFGLTQNGFKQYEIDVATSELQYRKIEIDLTAGMIYLRDGNDYSPRHEDEIVVLWNRDYVKEFFFHKLQNWVYLLTGRELAVNLSAAINPEMKHGSTPPKFNDGVQYGISTRFEP